MPKIALIGAGRIGKIHAANAVAHPDLTLSHVVDPVAEAAEAVARDTGAAVARSMLSWRTPAWPV